MWEKRYKKKNWLSNCIDEEFHKLDQVSISKVECIVITADDIEDFSFISNFRNLKQLYIYHSVVTNLSFLENLMYLKQLCICNLNTDNLNSLIKLLNNKLKKYEQDNNTDGEETVEGFRTRMKIFMEGIYINGIGNKNIEEQVDKLLIPYICDLDIYVMGRRIR